MNSSGQPFPSPSIPRRFQAASSLSKSIPPRRSQHTSSALGWPCLVMITRSPLRAAATSSERRAFASRMGTSMTDRSRSGFLLHQYATMVSANPDQGVTTTRRTCSSRGLTRSNRVSSRRFGAESRSGAGFCRSGLLPFALRCISGTHDGPPGLAGADAFLTLRAVG